MATISVQELREKQKELCDSFILDTDKMDEIMRKHTQKMVQGEFHNYSINNILLADFQLYMRTKETTELLSPFKRWNKVNRYVKKGEKALYILAPIFYEEEQDDGSHHFHGHHDLHLCSVLHHDHSVALSIRVSLGRLTGLLAFGRRTARFAN